ncbi:alpha-N-acetylgalactosaminide alpha-2,6-sialyltransferase 6 isoform X1 [Corvus moneduloides]|uniref:alpha-N-acetylgalactosaminide alpha-2,6-sialyltransferase 6 isoform X1 n=2 Tax=Corvus moneduloides TaxID=1196302 RepID=UPI001363A816|nr:alpha-N-acetylgalactosaminide alpha-2,6-sialyltransferase 6 isoform X1 [Corvus moneduloides]
MAAPMFLERWDMPWARVALSPQQLFEHVNRCHMFGWVRWYLGPGVRGWAGILGCSEEQVVQELRELPQPYAGQGITGTAQPESLWTGVTDSGQRESRCRPWPSPPQGPGSTRRPRGAGGDGLPMRAPASSGNGNEVFPYSRLRGRARRPPDLKKWGVKSGYLPVCGNKTLTARCHQCVIVTSSSHLLGTHLGTVIDGAECTIRMNDAPTTGYNADVGNKTSFRVVAHSSLYRVLKRPQEFVNKTPETIFIFWGPPTKMQKSLLKIIQRVCTSFPNMTAYVVSPGRMKQFDDLFRGETGKDREKSRSWLSTGWFTMVIAVELCDAVHVYGMVPPSYCGRRPPPRRLPYHYYEPKGPDECTTYIHNERSRRGNHHRFITEKRVFASWANLYNITFSHPTWT